MPRSRRKKADSEGGGHERWLLTYADMITLLMAFFIMMFSMSTVNLKKFNAVAISIRSGLGGITSGTGASILNVGEPGGIKPVIVYDQEIAALQQVAGNVSKYIEEEGLKNEVKLRHEERGLVISLMDDKVLFDRGQAYLKPETEKILEKIAEDLKDMTNQIRVEGNTCDIPINTPQFPSNWELSTTRATNVIQYLIRTGKIKATRLSAVGYADSNPLVPNDNEEHRATNRRVDIVILTAEKISETIKDTDENGLVRWPHP